jgi:GTP-binding protein HflX
MNSSHPLAEQQIEAVEKVLSELDVSSISKLMVWNKVKRYFLGDGVTKLVL